MKYLDEIRGEVSGEAMLLAAPDELAVGNAYVEARDFFFSALIAAGNEGREEDRRRIEASIGRLETEFRGCFANEDLALLCELTLRGERAYAEMYEVASPTSAAAKYSDAKDFFANAIGAARRCGRLDEAARLEQRLDHIRQVYRKQFV